MKKLIPILLVLTVLLSACGAKTTETPDVQTPAAETPTTEQPAAEPADTTAEPTTTEPGETTDPEEPQPTEEPTPTVGKLDENQDWVIVVTDETMTFEDEDAGRITVSYRVPAFNLAGEDAARLNREIAELCEEYHAELLLAQSEGCSPSCESVDFYAYENEYILSVVLEMRRPDDCVYYSTWNMNKETCCEITGAELLDCFDYTESAFVELATEAADACFVATYGDPNQDEFCREQYEKTVSPDSFSAYMPLFLNDNGNLCLITPVFALAGADYYETIIPLESFG